MDKDLEELEAQIKAKNSGSVETEIVKAEEPVKAPLVDFSPKPKEIAPAPEVSPLQRSSDEVSELVGDIFKGAVVSTVQNDDEVKQDILDTAKTVVTNKTEVLKNMAEKESKAAFFENNEAACQYFGYDEKTTSKTHVKIMAFWSFVLNTIYIFTIGFFVIAPITFICKKIKVVIKHIWVAAVLAILIYLAIILIPVLTTTLTGC